MRYLDVGLAFAALFLLCLFFNRRCGVAGGRTPLLAVSVILLWLTLAGVVGALRAGGWALYLGAAALGVLAVLPRRRAYTGAAAAAAPPLWDFAFVAFWVLSGALAVLFAVRQPLFAEWDEMSFWGTACKLVSQNDALYTTATVGWDWVGAQQPGAILLGYFFQFFGSFTPWKSFVGYDVLLFGCFAAVLSALGGDEEGAAASWRRYTLGLPIALLCVLTPYLLTEYCRILEVTNTYMSAYGDIPAGIAAGGAAAWYYAARRSACPSLGRPRRALARGMWGIFPVMAAAGLIKENVFPVVLVAAGIIAMDNLTDRAGTVWYRRAALAAGVLAAPVLAYLVWNRHVQAVVALRESAGEVGTTNLSPLQVVFVGVEQLLFPARRTAVFTRVLADMGDAFLHTRLTLVGSLSEMVLRRLLGAQHPLTQLMGTGLFTVLAILGLFALAALLCRDGAQRRRTLWAAGLSTLGMAGYYWMLILSYAFIFKETQAAGLSDYNRYVSSYYLFWMVLALAHVVCAARSQRPRGALHGAALACCLLALTATSHAVRPQMSALAYPQTTFAAQREFERGAQALCEQVEEAGLPGPIFFVSTRDNGLRYFNFCYQLLPLQLDYSFGGGPIGPPQADDGSLYYHALTCRQLAEYLAQRGCDYIYLDEYGEVFRGEYAPLFTDGLAAADAGRTQLYVRTGQGEEGQFAPWEEAQHG